MRPDDPNIKKQWVWVKGEPGSHIGGRWVEVDRATGPSTSAVDTLDGNDINRLQREMRLNINANMPGR